MRVTNWFNTVLAYFRGEAFVYRDDAPENFNSYESRHLRYAVNRAFYANNQYDELHTWARSFKKDQGLYRYIRGIYNPARRIGDFWRAHLMGGRLDREAGLEGALPIITDNQELRPAIAKLWGWSQWQAKKDVYTSQGAIEGDTAIKVVDDPESGRVRLQVIPPTLIYDLIKDAYGNVQAYTILHPFENDNSVSSYVVERAFKDGEVVTFELSSEHGEVLETKTTNYGFVPFIHRPHIDINSDVIDNANWGLSEYHSSIRKIEENDDLASKLNDQIRKLVETPWLLTGVKKPTTGDPITPTQGAASTDRPQPGREEVPILYGPDGAGAIPLVAPLPIDETLNVIKELRAELERDHPELQSDLLSENMGETSGKALRVARQRLENKVIGYRPNYDSGLVAAQQMAVAIAGQGNYAPEFASFNLDSFERGDLAHHIGERPIFTPDKLEQTAILRDYWEAVKLATESGVDVPTFMRLGEEAVERIDIATRSAARSRARQATQVAEEAVEEEVIEEPIVE